MRLYGRALEEHASSRRALSLAPRLQPGDLNPANLSINRFQRFADRRKTVQTVLLSITTGYHRAEATVLMRSLRVPEVWYLRLVQVEV
jgi:hypothetical protein